MGNASCSFAAVINCKKKKKGSSLCRCFGLLALLLCENSLWKMCRCFGLLALLLCESSLWKIWKERRVMIFCLFDVISQKLSSNSSFFLSSLHSLKCGTAVNACEVDVSVEIFKSYRSGRTGAARKSHKC